MLATSASRDLYRAFVRPAATEDDVLRVARIAAVVGSICGIALAMAYGSVRAAVSVFYAILTVTLFVPVVGGLYVREAGRREGMSSISAGVFVLGLTQVLTKGHGYGVLSPALAGVLASALAFTLARVVCVKR
jgi:solute:Na+ symporter, SSS family